MFKLKPSQDKWPWLLKIEEKHIPILFMICMRQIVFKTSHSLYSDFF